MKKSILTAAVLILLPCGAFAQSQDTQTVIQTPETVHTYHSQSIERMPDGSFVPVTSMTTTTESASVATTPVQPSLIYPEGNISEPLALDDSASSVTTLQPIETTSSSHHAVVTNTQAIYDAEGHLVSSSQVHHVEGSVQ